MKMNLPVIISFLCLLCSTHLYAQDDIQQVQEAWGKDKKELVRLSMALSPEDSVKFWPLYNEYEIQRQKLGRERILIIDDYMTNYKVMTNAKADDIINKIFKNDQALTQLQQQYYKKLKTALNAMQSARFLHIESYILTIIRSSLLEALPVIGDLDKMKTTQN